MSAPQRPLRDLLTTWETWSSRDTVETAAAQAEALGNPESAATLREVVADQPEVSALEALTAAHQLVILLSEWQAHAVAAAAAEGATWEQIGLAIEVRPEKVRADHAAVSEKRAADPGSGAAPADLAWLTCAQVGARVQRPAKFIRESAERGDLHGHQRVRNGRPLPKSRWTFAVRGIDAWVQGLEPEAQARACGCPQVAGARGRREVR